MEKDRKIKVLSLCALLVAVLGLTVAFAALSQTLTINGSATVNTASWDVHFENLEKNTNGAGSFNGEPTISETSITNINAVITKPEDLAEFDVDIVNKGSINAKVSSVNISKLCTLKSSVESCDWDNDGTVTQTDIDKVNDNISFVMAYYGDDDNGKIVKVGDVLKSQQTKKISVIIAYGKIIEENGSYLKDGYTNVEDATELPKRNLKFNDLSITITYEQAD